VNCGATGAITGIGNVLPRPVLHLVSLCNKAAAGDVTARALAAELEKALYVLSTFDEGVDLVLYFKHMMVLEGNPEYTLHINPTDQLTESQKNFATSQLKIFNSWYAAWSKANPAT
jgi:1-pyrroline-4-hydroxy-2-carboxylate deaminase